MSEQDAARIAELEKDNGRLRRLLELQDAPGELRHRLRNTLAILRTIIRSSMSSRRAIEDYAAHLEDRVDALARAQAAADQHGEIGLHQFLTDELFHYKISEGERALLSGPGVCFKPRAGQVFALALHELTINSIEHGSLGASSGRLEVNWKVDGAEPRLDFIWEETGSTMAIGKMRDGFGTEVLTRMLAYELKAETTIVPHRNGLRCAIRFPLEGRIGRLDTD